MKSLFNICLSFVAQRPSLCNELVSLPPECKHLLLDWLSAHDVLSSDLSRTLFATPTFGQNLTRLSFYLSDEVTDEILIALSTNNRHLRQVSIIYCSKISDEGVLAVTRGQKFLRQLELRSLRKLTSAGLAEVRSDFLTILDLSACWQICTEGLINLISINPNIRCLYLNNCKGLSDDALYAIGHYLGERLSILQLDFLPNLIDPSTTLFHISQQCPNIQQLSLCRYFQSDNQLEQLQGYKINGLVLRDLDLYGNYFITLPKMPLSVTSIRLSCTGEENVQDLIRRLRSQRYLTSIKLQLSCRDTDSRSVDDANNFLVAMLQGVGSKMTKLHISMPRLGDHALLLITECCTNLRHIAFDVKHMSTALLQRYFCGGHRSRACRLKSLKLCKLRVTYRVLFAIARGARNLEDLETSHMHGVDDRFLILLAENCQKLKNVNLSGCRGVTDHGLGALARHCPLKEVRIRATSVTDACVYVLAQFCPELEWIAHADYSGKPKFSDQALQILRNSCVQKVIC